MKGTKQPMYIHAILLQVLSFSLVALFLFE